MLISVQLAGLGGCEALLIGGGAVYSKAHGVDPVSKAYVALRRSDCSSADSQFSSVLIAAPNDVQAVSGKADALVCLGKYDDATKQYTHAIELDPKWFDYLGRGIAYKAQGKPSQALENFDQGIALAPTVPALFIYRGTVRRARGDAAGASADFEKVSSLLSGHPGRFNYYAWTLATSPMSAYRDGPASIQYATRACELSSWRSAPVVDTLAAAYAESGQFDEAAKFQAYALQLTGDYAKKEYETRLAMYEKKEPYRSEHMTPLFF